MPDEDVRYVVNVVAQDRVGIVAGVAEAVYQLGANIEALSQTVVWGWFTMLLCGTFPKAVSADQIREAVEAGAACSATVLPFGTPYDRSIPRGKGEPYVVTASGHDKPGIVRRLTQCFASKGINIEDVWNEVCDGRFIIIFHVTMPPDVDAKDARYDLDRAAAETGVAITLQHQDIFTATNSLDVHTRR